MLNRKNLILRMCSEFGCFQILDSVNIKNDEQKTLLRKNVSTVLITRKINIDRGREIQEFRDGVPIFQMLEQ